MAEPNLEAMDTEQADEFVIRKRNRTISMPPTEKSPSKKFAIPNPLLNVKKNNDGNNVLESKAPTCVRIVQDVKIPILQSLDKGEIAEFFKAYFEYQQQGGLVHAIEYIDAGVKSYVSRMNFDKQPTYDQIVQFIHNLVHGRTWTTDDIRQRLQRVCIDTKRHTSERKIESLFISMESAIEDMNMQHCTTEIGGVGISNEEHILLLLEKFPPKLKKLVENKMRYVVGSRYNVRAFQRLALEVAKEYRWK